ncbi:epoxide hydrolase family protein [Xylanimonas sp. McL0601]|uniref:epoxide hydrolase family protein n=1 Tax=Xylanimonas sp. McL0601 TaxID=3414739 RepID=UPI003CF934EF
MDNTSTELQPFEIHVPQADLDDLHDRLARTRWPYEVPGSGGRTDFTRGIPLAYLRELAEDWRDRFDWRAQERALNALGHVVTEIDGQRLHAVHHPSSSPDALPLLLCHGWPGDPVEFADLVGPLAESFHVVVPSLPGFGFSTPLSGTGWEVARTADAYAELMTRLGYERFGVHGSDIGAGVAGRLAAKYPDRVVGVHVASDGAALAMVGATLPVPEGLTDAELAQLEAIKDEQHERAGYYELQNTKPDTIGPALVDSPVGQLGWVAEKFHGWTHPSKELPDDAVGRDRLLTLASIYWFTRAGHSSARFYYEAAHAQLDWLMAAQVPTGWAVFDTRPLARRVFDPRGAVQHWSEFAEGGHFPAMEEPGLLLADLRDFFETVR